MDFDEPERIQKFHVFFSEKFGLAVQNGLDRKAFHYYGFG